MSGWIVANLPPHSIYCEPFAGAASILMAKPRCTLEIYNDLDENVVNLFRVLRSPAMAKDLENVLRLTPFARKEFEGSFSCPIADMADPIERARRLLIRCYMGLGSDSGSRPCRTGFRGANRGPRLPPPRDWVNYADAIPGFVDRLMGVLIECKPAIDVILREDTPGTLYYVDPPYVSSTRTSHGDGKRAYAHEMTDDDHRKLAEVLQSVQGMVVLSGYSSTLYDELYSGWSTTQRAVMAHSMKGAVPRTETLWFNPAAESRRSQESLDL